MKTTKKDIDNLTNEQVALMSKPVPRNELNWAESHQQIGLLFGLPVLALFFWFLLT